MSRKKYTCAAHPETGSLYLTTSDDLDSIGILIMDGGGRVVATPLRYGDNRATEVFDNLADAVAWLDGEGA